MKRMAGFFFLVCIIIIHALAATHFIKEVQRVSEKKMRERREERERGEEKVEEGRERKLGFMCICL